MTSRPPLSAKRLPLPGLPRLQKSLICPSNPEVPMTPEALLILCSLMALALAALPAAPVPKPVPVRQRLSATTRPTPERRR